MRQRETERQRDRHRERDTQRDTQRETQRDTQRETQRETQRAGTEPSSHWLLSARHFTGRHERENAAVAMAGGDGLAGWCMCLQLQLQHVLQRLQRLPEPDL